MRIGTGYDVHRLVEGRKLILCGVEVPYEKGLLGHSDADVALHAIADALLGAAAMKDIGYHFPDTDPAYAGADSIVLLKRVGEMLDELRSGMNEALLARTLQQAMTTDTRGDLRATAQQILSELGLVDTHIHGSV